MGNSISTIYQLKNSGENITLGVKIGDAQKGVSTVMVGENTVVSKKQGDFNADLGVDREITGQVAVCSTVVTAIQNNTKHTSVTVTLDGGVKPYQGIMEETVQNKGDVVIYSATFLLL